MMYATYSADGRIDAIIGNYFGVVKCTGEESSDTHYVDISVEPHELKEKEPLSLSQEADGLTVTITGIPEGSQVLLDNGDTVADGEPLTIEFDLPGTYTIEIEPPVQWLAETLEVTVGDA